MIPTRFLLCALLLSAVSCAPGRAADPDPKNELPFGYVDQPTNGATIERDMPASGWAMDDHGVAEVRIFLDNHFVARTTLTAARPDVSKAYPTYVHGNDTHGFSLLVPLGAGAMPGPHTILFQAVDNQGATRDFATVNVKLDQ